MNRNIKMRLKAGKTTIFPILIISIYLVYTVTFYIKSQIYLDGLLRSPNQPLLFYILKWYYSLLLLIGIIQLNKKATISYFFINSASIAIILLWILTSVFFVFYISIIDKFLLELTAIWLIIITNRASFIREYHIKRKKSDLLYLIAIPVIITIVFYYLILFLINSDIICLY